jgi:MFS family permease
MLFTLATSLLNAIAIRASRVLLALYALHLGAQPLTVGFIAATFSAFPTILSWHTGKLTDRYGARWLLVAGALGGAIGMVVPYFYTGLPALFFAAALNGISFTFYSVPLQNMVGMMSKPDERTRNFSNLSLMVAVSIFIGPMFAGFSIDYSGHAATCLYIALLSLVPAALMAIWGGALPTGTRSKIPVADSGEAPPERTIWRLLATGSLVQLGLDMFHFYMPVYGHEIGLSASAIGVVLAMFAVSAFVVRTVLPPLIARLGVETVLAWSFYIGAASFMMVPFFKSAIALGIISFLFGIGMGCGQPVTTMLTYSRSPKGRSGEALGLRMTVNHLTRTVGPVIFGSMGSAFGIFSIFWVTAAFMASGGILAHTDRPAASEDKSG